MPKRETIRSFTLQNEVTLITFYKRKQPTIAAIRDFLAQAMVEFKSRRAAQKQPDFHSEHFEARVVYGRNVFVTCYLVHAPDIPGSYLSPDEWIKVAVSASAAIDQMDINRTKARGWLKEVITALDQHRDLDAFEMVLDHIKSLILHRP